MKFRALLNLNILYAKLLFHSPPRKLEITIHHGHEKLVSKLAFLSSLLDPAHNLSTSVWVMGKLSKILLNIQEGQIRGRPQMIINLKKKNPIKTPKHHNVLPIIWSVIIQCTFTYYIWLLLNYSLHLSSGKWGPTWGNQNFEKFFNSFILFLQLNNVLFHLFFCSLNFWFMFSSSMIIYFDTFLHY